MNPEDLCAPGDQPEKEREREREREQARHEDQSSDGAEVLIQHCVSIYTVLQGSYFQQR